MFWDIALPVLAAIAQVLTGFLGWRVTVDGVRQERKKVYEWLFALASLIGIISVGIAAYRGSQISRDLADLRQGQQATNTGIKQIKEIAQTPPTVTVPVTINPPSQAATSRVRMVKLESAYHETLNGALTGRLQGLLLGKNVELNSHFVNDGTANADHIKGMGRIYLTKDETVETEKAVVATFRLAVKKYPWATMVGGTIEPGGSGPQADFWFTSKSDGVLSQEDMDKLANGTEVLYLLNYVTWSDLAGSHYIHLCRALQAPAFDPEVWHLCRSYEDQH
jgi:hypothetical protein